MSVVLVFCSTCQEVTGCQCGKNDDTGRLGFRCRACGSFWSEPEPSPTKLLSDYLKAHMREECGPEGAEWVQRADMDRMLDGRVSMETEADFLGLSDDDQLRVARYLGLIR